MLAATFCQKVFDIATVEGLFGMVQKSEKQNQKRKTS